MHTVDRASLASRPRSGSTGRAAAYRVSQGRRTQSWCARALVSRSTRRAARLRTSSAARSAPGTPRRRAARRPPPGRRRLDLDQPARAVRVGVDQLGLVVERRRCGRPPHPRPARRSPRRSWSTRPRRTRRPACTSAPTSGSCTKTMSPSASWAKSVMPTRDGARAAPARATRAPRCSADPRGSRRSLVVRTGLAYFSSPVSVQRRSARHADLRSASPRPYRRAPRRCPPTPPGMFSAVRMVSGPR